MKKNEQENQNNIVSISPFSKSKFKNTHQIYPIQRASTLAEFRSNNFYQQSDLQEILSQEHLKSSRVQDQEQQLLPIQIIPTQETVQQISIAEIPLEELSLINDEQVNKTVIYVTDLEQQQKQEYKLHAINEKFLKTFNYRKNMNYLQQATIIINTNEPQQKEFMKKYVNEIVEEHRFSQEQSKQNLSDKPNCCLSMKESCAKCQIF